MNNMIEKHETRLNELTGLMTVIMKDSILPGVMLVFAMLTKLSTIFGYDNVQEFMMTDDDILVEKLESLSEDEQNEAEKLYETICAQMDGEMSKIEVCQKLYEEADIVKNVLEAMTGNGF